MVKKKHVNDQPLDKEVIDVNPRQLNEEEFEKLYVHQIYQNISTHFSHTRYGCWKNVVKVVNGTPRNGVILDVGCGNGKYLNIREDCYFLGVDTCLPLLEICNERGKNNLLMSNNLRLPLRDNVSDLTLSIAVVHHISTLVRRLDAINELIRCTRTRGKILIYVWSFEQDKNYIGYREFSSQDVLVPWNLQSVYSTGSNNLSRDLRDSSELEGDHSVAVEGPREGAMSSCSEGKLVEESIVEGSNSNPNVNPNISPNRNPNPKPNPNPSPESDLNFKRYYHVFKREEILEIVEHFKHSVESTIYSDCNNWVIEMCKL